MGSFIDKYLQNFIKVYSSLPILERKSTIAVINNEPISWERAKIEIEGKTELGEIILKRLTELKIVEGK
jgi:hypothetical protein